MENLFPAFPLFTWYCPKHMMDRHRACHYTELMGFEPGGEQPSNVNDWMDTAIAKGFQGFYLQDTPDVLARVKAGDKRVRAILLKDEPNGAGALTPGNCMDTAEGIRQRYGLPVAINLDGNQFAYQVDSHLAAYVAAAGSDGFVCFDWYPVNYGGGAAAIPSIKSAVQRLQRFRISAGQRFYSILETGNQNIGQQDWTAGLVPPNNVPLRSLMRGPTVDEIEQEYEQAIDAGIDGLGHFTDDIGKGWNGFWDETPQAEGLITGMNRALLDKHFRAV